MDHAATDTVFHLGEEIANSITHGVGLLLSVAGASVLLVYAAIYGTVWHVVGCSIYGASLVLLYLSSTLYHALSATPARAVFRIFDHSAIYLLIAGTYTPVVLVAMRNALGLSVLAIVWVAGIAGIVFKSVVRAHDGLISSIVYVVLGWIAIVCVRPLLLALTWHGIAWIAAGGIFYTGGLIFFASSRRYAHSLWHICVLAGSLCHYVAIFRYIVLPR